MYNSFTIEGFRCFQSLSLPNLQRINLFGGKNNVGKTALLEAFFLHAAGGDPRLAARLTFSRGISIPASIVLQPETKTWTERSWSWLFNRFDPSKEIVLTAQVSENTAGARQLTRTVRLSLLSKPEDLRNVPIPQQVPPPPPAQVIETAENIWAQPSLQAGQVFKVFKVEFCEDKKSETYYAIIDPRYPGYPVPQIVPIPPAQRPNAWFVPARGVTDVAGDADRFGRMVANKQESTLVEHLQAIEPRLQRLEIVPIAGTPIIHADIGLGRLVPLNLLGEGMVRLTGLFLLMISTPDGVILLDEFENGLHYSVLAEIWRNIATVARAFDVQIFATTHSWECVAAAHNAFAKDSLYDFCYHRLEATAEGIRVVSYDRETLATSIEREREIR